VHIDIGVSLAGLLVGVVVGLTGMGGGALMTPILVLVFGIQPLTAVSSDLVASVVMKPIGGGIHVRHGTVHRGLVTWLALGSVPSAFLGAYLLSLIGDDVSDVIKTMLGVVLLVAAATMTLRSILVRRRTVASTSTAEQVSVRRPQTLLIGVVGGLVVGMTSVGSGSLIIVALLVLYPTLSSRELVGTDLVQAIPLVVAAAAGHMIWGDFELGLTGSLLFGCVPGVIVGANISSRAPDVIIRPALVLVLTLTALKLLGLPDEALAAVLVVAVTGAAGLGWRHLRNRQVPELPARAVLEE
jgi:uncharacterized membrane protein YfcA